MNIVEMPDASKRPAALFTTWAGEAIRSARRILYEELAEERIRRERAEASERELRQTLVFKEALVHEAHHRAKNTLQVAASLLSIQASASESAEVRRALQESNDRLYLLAKVHETLYRSADDTDGVLMPSLFEAMSDALRRSFPGLSDRVKLVVTADPVVLSADDAIPLALLANEAITNAFKHAFAGDLSGEIQVRLHSPPGNTVVLQVMDDGIGLNGSRNADGFGLRLIRSFATQLRGTLDFGPTQGSGTAITLSIHR